MEETNEAMNSALSGIRVLELSDYDSGAACGEMLAWLGADVVKVEPPGGVKSRRSDQAEADAFRFIVFNANKRSMVCDPESQGEKEELQKLIANADVILENLAPGAMQRLGLTYDALSTINPGIVLAQIVGFPSDGPCANYLSTDLIGQSVGGAVAVTGYENGPPLKPGAAIGDTGTALHVTMGVLAALHQRRSTGRGQRVEVSMQGSVINLNRTVYQQQLKHGKPPRRLGNNSRNAAVPSNLYPCKPGGPNDYAFVNVSRSANAHWRAVVKAIGANDWESDSSLSTYQNRFERRAEIEARVAAWCRQLTKTEVMSALQTAGAAAGAVLDVREVSEDRHLRKRGTFTSVRHPVRGNVVMPAWPVRMSASQVAVRSAPLLGAHTSEVLAEWGLSRQDRSQCDMAAAPAAALAGIRVVDLTQLEAGTSCTEALAWLGADVVKIEEPKKGDKGRYGNTERADADAHYFILLNANKRSVALDLKSEGGKQILRKLIVNADILVENLAPGAIERLGFGYDEVRKLNPRLIFAQIKGFPPDGPYAKYLCFDMVAQSVGGTMSTSGTRDGTPIRPGPNLGDTGSGLHCAVGILAALCQRDVTGIGQRIEVAMQEVVASFNRNVHAAYLESGKVPDRDGDRDVYRCKGGGPSDYCAIAISDLDDAGWRHLVQSIDRADLETDKRFATAAARAKHRSEIDAILSTWCSERTKTDAMEIMQRAGIAAGAVFDTKDLSEDQNLRNSGIFATVDHPVRGAVTIPAWPVKMGHSTVAVDSAPLLGANTAEVLSEWLGLGAGEIDEIRRSGAPAASPS